MKAIKKALFSIMSAIAIAASLALCGCAAAGYTVFQDVQAFSDDIMFSAKILGARADYAYKRMVTEITEINAQASLTRTDSDISRFNASGANVRVEVGEHVYALFNLAKEYYALTDGAFNCAAAALCELWHISAQDIGSGAEKALPTQDEVQSVKEYCTPENIRAESSNGKYYLTKTDGRVRLDFGGIAKGYAVDRCVDILDEYDISSALLDISGNAYFYGRYIDGGKQADWNVGVMSPRPRSGETLSRGYVCAISLGGDVSAVTSGDYMRYYVHSDGDGNSLYIPHILGADGVPIGVEYDGDRWKNSEEWVMSATVIGESSAKCDALSTAASALGIEKGAQLLRKVGYKGLIFSEKRFTIIGEVPLYNTAEYNGYKDYEYCEL